MIRTVFRSLPFIFITKVGLYLSFLDFDIRKIQCAGKCSLPFLSERACVSFILIYLYTIGSHSLVNQGSPRAFISGFFKNYFFIIRMILRFLILGNCSNLCFQNNCSISFRNSYLYMQSFSQYSLFFFHVYTVCSNNLHH